MAILKEDLIWFTKDNINSRKKSKFMVAFCKNGGKIMVWDHVFIYQCPTKQWCKYERNVSQHSDHCSCNCRPSLHVVQDRQCDAKTWNFLFKIKNWWKFQKIYKSSNFKKFSKNHRQSEEIHGTCQKSRNPRFPWLREFLLSSFLLRTWPSNTMKREILRQKYT